MLEFIFITVRKGDWDRQWLLFFAIVPRKNIIAFLNELTKNKTSKKIYFFMIHPHPPWRTVPWRCFVNSAISVGFRDELYVKHRLQWSIDQISTASRSPDIEFWSRFGPFRSLFGPFQSRLGPVSVSSITLPSFNATLLVVKVGKNIAFLHKSSKLETLKEIAILLRSLTIVQYQFNDL